MSITPLHDDAARSVLDAVNTVRSMANVPEWEFAVEFILDGITGALRHGGGKVPLSALAIAAFKHPSRELGASRNFR